MADDARLITELRALQSRCNREDARLLASAITALEIGAAWLADLRSERDAAYRKGQGRMRARASFLASLAHATVKDNSDASSALFDMTMGIRALPIEEKP